MPDQGDADALAGAPATEPKHNPDEPKMLFYNAEGKRVKADDASAVRQYLSDDAARPDAAKDEEGRPVRMDAPNPAPELVYADAEGNLVDEPVTGGKQYDADDPRRPKVAATKAASKPAEDKARKSSDNK